MLAVAGAAAISLTAGLLTWAGAESAGVGVSLPRMLEAGANCLPVGAAVPRASRRSPTRSSRERAPGIAYGLVTVAFLWQLFGSLLGAPKWLVDLTPFAHVGLVPAQPFRAGAAVVMLAIAVASALAAVWFFQRHDLTGP